MKKRFSGVSLILIMFVIFESVVWAAPPKRPIIMFNDKILTSDVAPAERYGRMLVPTRIIADALFISNKYWWKLGLYGYQR